MSRIISEKILPEFMGEKDVVMRFMDDGKIYYITKNNSADDIIIRLGVCRFEVIEDDNKHVLFLYDSVSKMVGGYYMSKGMHGFTAQEIIAQRDVLSFYKTWSNENKKWMPCVWGNLDRNCIVKEWNGIRTVFKDGKWYIDCGNIHKRFYLVLPGKYDFIDDFNEQGMAKVKINGKIEKIEQKDKAYDKWGMINIDGEEIIPVSFIKIENVCNKKWKFVKLIKYEEGKDGTCGRMIREYLLDLNLYTYNRKVKLFPLDDGFYEDSIQSILLYAKHVLDEEDIICLESVLIQMNENERKSVLKIWKEDDLISKEDKVREILKWNLHWFYVSFKFKKYDYDYIKDRVPDFEKKQFFWMVLFEEVMNKKHHNTDFPSEFHVYSENNLKRLVEWYNKNHLADWSQDEEIVSSEKKPIEFQRIDKNDYVIRKHTHNKETILEIRKKDSPTFYYKNIRSLTELLDSLGDSESILIRHDISKPGIEINGCFYYYGDNILGCPIYKIIEKKDSLVVCGFSQDLVNWKDYIIEEKIMMAIRANPVTFISDERAVTQDSFGQWGVIDLSGNIIVPKGKYAKIDGFKFNLAKVKRVNTVIHWEDMSEDYYDTFGIIDINGNEVVECEYDTIYKFYGNDKWYTTMFKDGKSAKFHLGYWTTFGDFSDVERYQYLEERGSIEWKGGDRSLKKESCGDEDSNCNYSVWDALEDNPEAAGNIDYEGD